MAAFNFQLLNQLVDKAGSIGENYGSAYMGRKSSGRFAHQQLGNLANMKYNLLALLMRGAQEGQSSGRAQASGRGAGGTSNIPHLGFAGMLPDSSGMGQPVDAQRPDKIGPGQYVAGQSLSQIPDKNIAQQLANSGAVRGMQVTDAYNPNTTGTANTQAGGAYPGGIAPGTVQQLGSPTSQTANPQETFAEIFNNSNYKDNPAVMKMMMEYYNRFFGGGEK